MKNKKIIAVDFDATLSTYIRPWKYNILGQPINQVIQLIRHFDKLKYYILIFTNRLETKELTEWLNKNEVPYHAINTNPSYLENASNFKPFYDLIIDDKAINPMFTDGKYKCYLHLLLESEEVLKIGQIGKEDK